MFDVRVQIHPDQVVAQVNPMLFGNFIEFTHDCINRGMWAELLLNRGFEDADDDGDGLSGCWRPIGFNDSALVALDAENAFGGAQSQRIQVVHHFGGERGIAQRGLLLEAGEMYRGSLWARTADIGAAVLRLVDAQTGAVLWQGEAQLSADGEWRKYAFEAAVHADCLDAEFQLCVCQQGTIWLDQLSLMPRSAIGGIWKRVMEASGKLQSAIMRFPGGCFADCYHWRDGVGERDRRPTLVNRHWGGNEQNNFGTDEFIAFCRNTRTEPLICVNLGSGTPEEAADWVEYCNGGADTAMGALRAKHGHPEPFGVTYWGIGNETWATWEIGHMDAAAYAQRYLRFVEAMRAVDPAIRLMACGGDGNSVSQDWNRTVLQRAGHSADYLDLHFYAPQVYEQPNSMEDIYYATVLSTDKYERILLEAADIARALGAPTRLAVAEYNAMYYNNSSREHTQEAAVFNAGLLNVFLRQAEMVHIGNFSDLVNGWQGGCIRSDRGRIFLTPSYHVLELYSNARLARVLRCETDAPSLSAPKVGHVEARTAPLVDCAACLDSEGDVRVFVVNRHMRDGARVQLALPEGYQIRRIQQIAADHPWDLNSFGRESIGITCARPLDALRFNAPPHAVCMVILERAR